MRALLAPFVFCLGFGATAAQADDKPAPFDCVKAYVLIDRLRDRERDMNIFAQKKGDHLNYTGLGQYLLNYSSIDFHARADEVAKKYPTKDGWGMTNDSFDATLGIDSDYVDGLMMEGSGAALNAMLNPNNVYKDQIPLFAQVRACDLAYGFTPALPAAPTRAEVIARIGKKMDDDQQQRKDRLAALSDLQCTVRFAGAASLFPAGSPGQQTLQQHYVAGLARLQPTMSDMPPEQVKERLQREMEELSGFLQRKVMKPRDLVEEVNYCETRFGLPVTTITVNDP